MAVDSQPVVTIKEPTNGSSEGQQLKDQVAALTEQVALLATHMRGTNQPIDHIVLISTSLDMYNVITLPGIICVLPVASQDIYQEIAGIRDTSKGHLQQAPPSISAHIDLKDVLTVTAVVK